MPPRNAQYRYHQLPPNSPALALPGPGRAGAYGGSPDEPHYHNLLEIGYCHEGRGRVAFGQEEAACGPGSVTVIPPGFLHRTLAAPGAESRWEYLFVDAPSLLQASVADKTKADSLLARVNAGCLHLTRDERPALGHLAQAVTGLYRERGELYEECAFGLLSSLLVHIAREHPPLAPENPASPADPLLHQALAFAGGHYHRKITVMELAEACHMSESHFRRLFHRAMGTGPLAFLNHVRVEAACRLLDSPAMPVREVALRCGFPTLSTFNRNFRSLTGVTPQQWRHKALSRQPLPGKDRVWQHEGWQ